MTKKLRVMPNTFQIIMGEDAILYSKMEVLKDAKLVLIIKNEPIVIKGEIIVKKNATFEIWTYQLYQKYLIDTNQRRYETRDFTFKSKPRGKYNLGRNVSEKSSNNESVAGSDVQDTGQNRADTANSQDISSEA